MTMAAVLICDYLTQIRDTSMRMPMSWASWDPSLEAVERRKRTLSRRKNQRRKRADGLGNQLIDYRFALFAVKALDDVSCVVRLSVIFLGCLGRSKIRVASSDFDSTN